MRLGILYVTGDGLHAVGHFDDDETEDEQDLVLAEAHPLLYEAFEVEVILCNHHIGL